MIALGVTPDPNWLPSTLAQATAALVAIVGGFLVSRLIVMASTRAALEQRIASLRARLGEVNDECVRAHETSLAFAMRIIRDEDLQEWVEAGDKLDLDEKLRAARLPIGLDVDELRPAGENLRVAILEIVDHVEAAIGSQMPPADLKGVEALVGAIPEPLRDIYSAVRRQLERKATIPASVSSSLLASISSGGVIRSSYRDRLDASMSRETELGVDRRTLETELRLAKSEAAFASETKGVWPGLWVLVLFAGLGIVYPMSVMSERPVPDDPATRARMVAAFVVGFLFFLLYVGIYAWRVTRVTIDQDDPAWIGSP